MYTDSFPHVDSTHRCTSVCFLSSVHVCTAVKLQNVGIIGITHEKECHVHDVHRGSAEVLKKLLKRYCTHVNTCV